MYRGATSILPKMKHLFYLALLLTVASACNLQQDIEIELPLFDEQPLVECYLEPGLPYRLTLSTSQAFLAEVTQDILIDDATVTIGYDGQEIELENGLFIDFEFSRVYNYRSPELVPFDTERDFTLRIVTADGRTITDTTRILPAIPIDSLVTRNNGDTLNLVLTYITDPADEDNFYRRVFYEDGTTISNSEVEQDFSTDDAFVSEGGSIVFGTAFEYVAGDTVFSAIYHIDEDYFNFINSVQTAVQSNGNPFAIPNVIQSTVTGAYGVFTGLSYDRDTLIIGQ